MDSSDPGATTEQESTYAQGMRDAAAMLEMTNQTIRLHAGELSAQEMRAVQAVLGWKRREMLARAGS